MAKYISLGQFNKNHIYIILSIISLNLQKTINGFNFLDSFKTVFAEDSHGNFNKYYLINYIFCYIGTFLLSFIFYIKESKYYKRPDSNLKEEKEQLNDKKLSDDIIIYIHPERNNLNDSKNTFYFFFFINFLWIIEEHLMELFIVLKDLDFWPIEVIIISILNSKMFHLKIFRHHILVYFINFIPIILKIIVIVL